MAIDDFLVENETFPYLVYVNNLDVGEDLNQNCNFKCSYCDKIARYALKIKSWYIIANYCNIYYNNSSVYFNIISSLQLIHAGNFNILNIEIK